jgi:hypothetical protein
VRDSAYEWHFLREAESAAERRFGIPAGGYRQRVQSRLEIGAERYGEGNFLKVDVVKELLEETPDVGAYAVLEAQKQMTGEVDDGKAWHLFEAAVHGAAADYHARMARRSNP